MKKLEITPDSILNNNNMVTPAPLTPEKKKEDISIVLEGSGSKMITPDPDAIDDESEESKQKNIEKT